MAVTRGQASTFALVGSGSSVTTTWSTNPSAGNSILVFANCVVQPSSCVDNGTIPATFTLDASNTNPDGAYIFRANNITLPASGSYAVTVTGASGHTYQAWGMEYIGLKSGSPDATSANHGTGTSISSGSVTPAAAGGLVFGGFDDDTSLNPETITFTGSSPLTEQMRNTNGSGGLAAAAADALTGSAQNLTWTIGDSQPWAAVAAAYSPASTGSSSVTRDQASGAYSNSSTTAAAVTWGTNPAAGSTVLLFVQCAGTISGVADNGATPSTFVLDASTSAGRGAFVYRANNITLPASGSYVVTVTTSSATTVDAFGYSYLNVAAGPPIATNTGSATGTSVASGSAAPTGGNGLVFGGFSDASGLNPETITFTGSSPLAEQFRQTNASSFWACAAADGLTSASQNLTWTLGDSVAWGAVIAAYNPSTGSGGTAGGPPVFLASYSPGTDWTSATTPKADTVTASNADVLVIFGGTQDASTTLGLPSDGTNTYAQQQARTVTATCAGYAWSSTVGTTPLTVTTASLPAATAGTAYSQQLTASGGTGSGRTWTISAGALPAWASLSSGGVISGTPAGSGNASFTVLVTDSGNNTGSKVLSIATSGGGGVTQPSGPSGTWTLKWNDEFNDAAGMSGATRGLNTSKWNIGFYFSPSAPGGTGYTGLSPTSSRGGGAIEFYGPGALTLPGGGGLVMTMFAAGAGPDGASYSQGGTTFTTESGMINTAGLLVVTPNTGYTPATAIAPTVIQAANIVVEYKIQMAGPSAQSTGYWQWIGTYNSGDCATPGYPNAGNYDEEFDLWEELSPHNIVGQNMIFNIHAASEYGGMTSAPSSLQTTDLSLAYHTYTVQWTYSAIKLWIDGQAVSGINPTAAQLQAQWAEPHYLGIAFQAVPGYTATGVSGATPMKIAYVRVFTQ